MKRSIIIYALLTAIIGTSAVSCRDEGYIYGETDHYNYYSGQDDPPKKTTPGKIIFTYVFESVLNCDDLMTEVMMFNRYYTASSEERVELRNGYFLGAYIEYISEEDAWKVMRGSKYIKYRMHDGLSLSEPGGRWSIARSSDSKEYDWERVVTYHDSETVSLELAGLPLAKEFMGGASLLVGYEYNLQTGTYWCSYSGEGSLTCVSEDKMVIDYVIEPTMIKVSEKDRNDNYYGYYQGRSFTYFNGAISMDVKGTSTGNKVVRAILYWDKKYRIEYGDKQDEWIYYPQERYYY